MFTGIDIGGTKCAVTLGNERGEVLKKIKFKTTSMEETLNNIIAAVEKLGCGEAIGISCGGPLNEKTGVIMSPPHLPDWDNVPIADILSSRFSVPVNLRNDANACALAEWKFGAGKGTENMVFLTFGTGLGAGLILNGKLYSGTHGMAGEIGHMRLADIGPSGYGKCGSFEGFCSGSGLIELGRILSRGYVQRGTIPSFINKEAPFDAGDMAKAARNGDACAKEAFDICAEMLGKGLAVIVDMLDPEVIIIGSVYARCKDLLESGALKVMKKEALSLSAENCRVTVPLLGENIGDAAALAVASEG